MAIGRSPILSVYTYAMQQYISFDLTGLRRWYNQNVSLACNEAADIYFKKTIASILMAHYDLQICMVSPLY